MEQINKIELRGNVGNVKLQTVGNNENIRFSVATNYAYKDKEGRPVIETTWPDEGMPWNRRQGR